MEETKDTETTPPAEGDPSQTESPDAEGESRAPESEDYVRVPRGEFASWKTKVEEANELKRQLIERSELSPAAPEEQPEDYWSGVDEFGRKGDPVARATREINQKLDRFVGAVSTAMEIQQIKDDAERTEVERMVLKGMDVRSARANVRNRSLEAENTKLAAENKRLSVRERDPDVVRTHDREVTASELKSKSKMTESQFDQRQASLRKQGKFKQAMKEQGMLANDDIEMEWGR